MRRGLLRCFYGMFGGLLALLLAACCASWTHNAPAALAVARKEVCPDAVPAN